jgi:SMC interacting uncharacterized protein involved in chromosome segregation
MTNKHGLLDSLKHLAFEEDSETAAKPPASPSAPVPTSLVAPAPAVSAPVVNYPQALDAGVIADSDEVYQKLVAKTDFEVTEVAATIHKFLQPLGAIPDNVMPPNVKFKTAVLQAKAQSGLTEEGILACFDGLHATLQKEQDAFNAKAQQFAAREIAQRQDRIGQITAQLAQLQQELAQLSSELLEAQGKAAHAQSQFSAAVQRRNAEIEQQKAQYAGLLKT